MKKQKDLIKLLKQSQPELEEKYHVKKIGVFGSYAKGTNKNNSDIDIFLEFEKPIGLQFLRLSEFLENLLDTRVDILTPEGINSIRIKSVIEDINKSIVYV